MTIVGPKSACFKWVRLSQFSSRDVLCKSTGTFRVCGPTESRGCGAELWSAMCKGERGGQDREVAGPSAWIAGSAARRSRSGARTWEREEADGTGRERRTGPTVRVTGPTVWASGVRFANCDKVSARSLRSLVYQSREAYLMKVLMVGHSLPEKGLAAGVCELLVLRPASQHASDRQCFKSCTEPKLSHVHGISFGRSRGASRLAE